MLHTNLGAVKAAHIVGAPPTLGKRVCHWAARSFGSWQFFVAWHGFLLCFAAVFNLEAGARHWATRELILVNMVLVLMASISGPAIAAIHYREGRGVRPASRNESWIGRGPSQAATTAPPHPEDLAAVAIRHYLRKMRETSDGVGR